MKRGPGGRAGRRVLAAAVLAVLAGIAARGASPRHGSDGLRGAPAGPIVDLAGERVGERIEFEPDLAPALLARAPEEPLSIADWPVAPGVRRTIRVARHEVYAPGARDDPRGRRRRDGRAALASRRSSGARTTRAAA